VHERSLSAKEVRVRWGMFFAVFGVHVGLFLIVEVSVRSSPRQLANPPVMLWLRLTAPSSKILAPTHIRVRPPKAVKNSAAWPPPAIASLPPPDWRVEAQRGASAALAAEDTAKKRGSAIGGTPFSNFNAGAHGGASRPPFPWSRQPLSGVFDFNPDTFEVTLQFGRRCGLSYFLFVVGFGCVLGPINPEPGRGDLFDPKFRSGPVELPVPLMSMQVQ